jgi:hypothetical protein
MLAFTFLLKGEITPLQLKSDLSGTFLNDYYYCYNILLVELYTLMTFFKLN